MGDQWGNMTLTEITYTICKKTFQDSWVQVKGNQSQPQQRTRQQILPEHYASYKNTYTITRTIQAPE